MRDNIILDTDSYKFSHYRQYPAGTQKLFAYLEARGGRYGSTIFFGLQPILERLATRVTKEDVEEAEEIAKLHGVPFPKQGWMRIVDVHQGKIPLQIRAVREGARVPVRNALMTVVSTDDQLPWVTTWFETQLMRVWYPTTVATKSYYCKKAIWESLVRTSDSPSEEILFKLHDFGSRGVSSFESAGIGGAAHLVNFNGTDTVAALAFVRQHYGAGGHPDKSMPGFSIPAMEHSTVTAWGRQYEAQSFFNMIQLHPEFNMLACVSDSYDIDNAVEQIWCDQLLEYVRESKKQIVIRPDSGDAAEVTVRLLRILDRKLECKPNMKGFKVLPPCFRIIWGDGNKNEDDIQRMLLAVETAGFSTSNIAFGMGGGLLQLVDRDTCQFAYKTSAAFIRPPTSHVEGEGGSWVDVKKEPKTDAHKVSKAGRLDLISHYDIHSHVRAYQTVVMPDDTEPSGRTEMVEVFRDGEVIKRWSFDDVRAAAREAI